MHQIRVNLGSRSYAVHIGPGARSALGEITAEHVGSQSAVVIADEHVADLHMGRLLDAIDPPPTVVKVPPGEASKSLARAGELYDALAAARMERGGLILTFGGGMVGDLGGFVAATWLRGISFVQVPTTLLAAVDASVGGKTGVNHPSGKNLIGAFHQPRAVVIDLDFLATLEQRDLAAGLAESVKHALIRDGEFFEWHEQHADAITAREPDVLAELIARNCQIKADVVSRDEREQGLRAILNFGHTVGHAIEHLLGYELRHGECVALGMIAVNELTCARGLLDRQIADRTRRLLDRLGLPTRLPRRLEPAEVVAACRMDKKVRGGRVNFVLISAPGQTVRVADVTDEEIIAAVETLQPGA